MGLRKIGRVELASGPALPLPVQARSHRNARSFDEVGGYRFPRQREGLDMFDRRKNIQSFEVGNPHSSSVVLTTTFAELGAVTTTVDRVENGRPSFLLRFELTGIGTHKEYADRRNGLGSNLVLGADEKELPNLIRLTGRRLLLTTIAAEEDSVEKSELQTEVNRLQGELSRLTERFEMLQTNYLTLVEESRRLS